MSLDKFYPDSVRKLFTLSIVCVMGSSILTCSIMINLITHVKCFFFFLSTDPAGRDAKEKEDINQCSNYPLSCWSGIGTAVQISPLQLRPLVLLALMLSMRASSSKHQYQLLILWLVRPCQQGPCIKKKHFTCMIKFIIMLHV